MDERGGDAHAPPLDIEGCMIKIEFDFAELERAARSVGAAADQIPYAMSLALNRSAEVTRNFLIKQTWPTHVTQRNASFIAASLTTRDSRASKTSLAVEIYDKLNRGNLQLQAKGGTRTPRGGGSLAVPVSTIKKGARGVPARLRPKALQNSFKRNGKLYTRDKRGRIKLVYTLKPTTAVPKRVPFYEDFAASMNRELKRTIPLAVAKAMSTRRR
jgi:hypothetical protein